MARYRLLEYHYVLEQEDGELVAVEKSITPVFEEEFAMKPTRDDFEQRGVVFAKSGTREGEEAYEYRLEFFGQKSWIFQGLFKG